MEYRCSVIRIWGLSEKQLTDDRHNVVASTQGMQYGIDTVRKQGGYENGVLASQCTMTNMRIQELATCL